MDTTSVLGSFAYAGSGNGKSVRFGDKWSPIYSYQTTGSKLEPICEVAGMADLCPGAR